MKKEQTVWPEELSELFDRISSIPANDELELRVAVHDLQSFATQGGAPHRDIDKAILASCCDILRHAAQNLVLSSSEEPLKQYHSKPYVRSINALIRTLLPSVEEPHKNLCLDGLQLQRCNLDHIDLSDSSLRMTDLSHSRMSRATLTHSDLRFANLMSATLTHINLAGSLMECCEMDWCDLSHADLHRCQLMHADLGGSILDHADLSYAILSGCNLANATLNHANLSCCNLFGARLHSAKLFGCDLTGTGITPERLENAHIEVQSDRGTIWGSKTDCAGRNPLDPAYYITQQSLL